MIKAIVFDFDGLILDTETHEFRAWQQIYTQHGAELELDIWGKCIGTDASAFNPYDYLEQLYGSVIDRVAVRASQHRNFEELIKFELPRPGVVSYLQSAKALGLKIGLASSSKLEWVTRFLRQFELLDYFHCIRTSEYVLKVKPDPELYAQTLQCLGVRAHQAIAFEDSPNGSLAAKRAGMHCVIVPNEVTATLVFGEVDMRIASMSELELHEVISIIERQ